MDYLDMLKWAVESEASDIHLVPGAIPTYRKNGVLHRMEEVQVLDEDQINHWMKAIVSEQLMEALQKEGACHFSYAMSQLGRFRVHIMKQRGSYCISIRILRSVQEDAQALGLPPELMTLCEKPKGLLLVTGPSGSGKSTSLAAMIEYLNQRYLKSIMTIESPIESLFKHKKSTILQREVGSDCSSLIEGMRSSLLHDPDVVVVSMITKKECEMALKIAESGKLVIAGVGTINARNTVGALIPEGTSESIKYRFTSALIGIFSQQLIPSVSEDHRLLAYELLLPNEAFRQCIFDETYNQITKVIMAGQKEGMTYMDYCLYDNYQSAKISKETLYRYAHHLTYVKRMEIRQASHNMADNNDLR